MRLVRWLLLGMLALLIVAGAGLLLADTGWGHSIIAKQVSSLRPKSGLVVEIGSIDGSIYSNAIVKGLRLSDPQGLFLSAPEATLDWHPVAWLSNVLDVEDCFAPVATLYRLPKLRPSDPKASILPDFDIAIGRLEIGRLQIEPGVAGERRDGHIKAAFIARKGRALVRLDADAKLGDRMSINLDAEPDRNKFELAGTLSAPAGGVFAAMLGTSRPADASISGQGSWTSWRGQGRFRLAGAEIANLSLNAETGHFGVNGLLSLSTLTSGKVRQLVGEKTRIRGSGILAERRVKGELNLASDSLTLRTTGAVDLGSNQFDDMMIDARLLRPADLFANMTGKDIALQARLNGSFSSTGFDYLFTAPRLAFDQTGFENLRASGQGHWSRAPVTVPIKLTATRVTGVGDVAGGILAHLAVDGLLQVTNKAVIGDGLRFSSDKLSGHLGLFVDLASGVYDVGVAGQLQRYEIPGLGIVDIKSELKVIPGEGGRGTRVIGQGEAWVRRFDNPFLASLVGGLPTLKTGLARATDGTLQLIGLRLSGPKMSISGNGVRRLDGTFQFSGSGTQGDYGPLKLSLDGQIQRPKLDILLAHPANAMGLANVHLLLDPSAYGYGWRADGRSTLGGFTGNGQLLLTQGQATVIDIAQLVTSGMKASGRLQSTSSGFAGRLALNGGGINGTLDLSPIEGKQRIEAHLKAFDAKFEGPPAIFAKRGQFDGTVILDPAGTTVEGTVLAQGLSRGPLSLARLAANVRLRNGVGDIRAAFSGSRGRAFDLQTVAHVEQDKWQVIGSGTIDRKPVALDSPAHLIKEASGWRLSPVQMSFAGGRARVSGLFGDTANEVEASLSQMPLGIFDILSPGLGLGGIANGELVYRQATNAEPSGSANLKIKGLTRSGLVLSSQPIDMGIAASLNAGIAGIRAVAVSGGREVGRAQARLMPGRTGGLYDRFAKAPLLAQIRYSGSADALWRLSGVETLDVTGPVALGADLSGTMNDPVIRGSIQTSNGRIESPATGMVLTNVAASGRFGNGSQLIFDNISATAGRNGKVSGSGTVDLAAERGFAVNLTLNADQAVLIARDDLEATVTGAVKIASDGAEGVVSGDILLNRSRFRLGRVQPVASLPKLNVREINGHVDEAGPDRPVLPWRLALKARVPNRLMVTGLGLESEWRADLEIGGTPLAPLMRGKAELINGDYEFAGRRFAVTRGSIRFQGESPPDPIIDIFAQGDTQGINANIRVTGTGQRPEIKFASTPALPEDELLSRLLFGTSITNLSAPEAVQLAAAVASLRDGGNGVNPINIVRSAIGLDRLRILPADTVTGQRTSIAAGKYLSRRAYVEVVTDGQGYSATRAEFQVTRWLSLLSSISTIGRQSAALRVTKDY